MIVIWELVRITWPYLLIPADVCPPSSQGRSCNAQRHRKRLDHRSTGCVAEVSSAPDKQLLARLDVSQRNDVRAQQPAVLDELHVVARRVRVVDESRMHVQQVDRVDPHAVVQTHGVRSVRGPVGNVVPLDLRGAQQAPVIAAQSGTGSKIALSKQSTAGSFDGRLLDAQTSVSANRLAVQQRQLLFALARVAPLHRQHSRDRPSNKSARRQSQIAQPRSRSAHWHARLQARSQKHLQTIFAFVLAL